MINECMVGREERVACTVAINMPGKGADMTNILVRGVLTGIATDDINRAHQYPCLPLAHQELEIRFNMPLFDKSGKKGNLENLLILTDKLKNVNGIRGLAVFIA